MFDTKTLGVAVGAAIVGVLIGNAIGSGGATEDAMTRRVAALAGQVEALAGQVGALSGVTGEMSALGTQVGALGGEVGALGGRVTAVDEHVAAVSAAIGALGVSVDTSNRRLAEIGAVVASHGPAAAAAPAAAAPAAGAAPAAATEPSEAERLAALAGPDALVLSVGQTGTVGEQRVFLSRVADDAAHVVLVGSGKASVGRFTGPLDLGNGCTLAYVGAAGRTVYLRPEC